MKRFLYGFDPVCLTASACYAGNRWLIPMAFKGAFLRGHFADLLLIPAGLPLILWLQRRLGVRHHDAPPTWREVALHVVAWSISAELVAPHLFARSTGDPWDVAAYAVGGIGALLCWQTG